MARDPMSSQQDRVQALLLLNTMASNNIERKVVLEMLCNIDDKYLPQLKQVESDIANDKVQAELDQQRLQAEKYAKQYLEFAKLWRERIVEWKKRTSSMSAGKPQYYSDYYDYNELVESMEFCLNKALSLAPDSDVSREAFEFYFDILFQEWGDRSFKIGWFSVKLDAKSFEEQMSKIIRSLEIYETMYPDSPKVLPLMWDIHDIFYSLSLSGKVPRNRRKIKEEHRDLAYYGSMFDFYMLSLDWLDRIMKKSKEEENFYSDMARRKYRFMHRFVQDQIDNNLYRYHQDKPKPFVGVETRHLDKIQEEIKKRISQYPVLELGIIKKNRNE